ncbi:hypothetical protein GGS20DRAFT_490114 [Poronia punctata]|nr:hypothetical protein GGS20DRAFT_490114 [Poronia punctata]
MTRDDGRVSSMVSTSSGMSNITVKPPTPSRTASNPSSSKLAPRPIKTNENGRLSFVPRGREGDVESSAST